MLPVKFLWGSVLLRGELQKYAKNSNFENFQSALYSTSVSMPLRVSWKDKRTNDWVLSKVGCELMLRKTIDSRKLRYFGHISRKDGSIEN